MSESIGMRIAQSPDFLQSVIDDPRVFPWLVEDGITEAPLAAVFADGIGVEFDAGGFFFHRLGDGIYEVHTLFLPGVKDALAHCRAAAHFMFCGTPDCTRIVTKVPVDNVPARKLTERMDFRLDHVRPAAFTRGGVAHDVNHYSLHMDDWMRAQTNPRWVAQQCAELNEPNKGIRALYRWAVMYQDHVVLGE